MDVERTSKKRLRDVYYEQRNSDHAHIAYVERARLAIKKMDENALRSILDKTKGGINGQTIASQHPLLQMACGQGWAVGVKLLLDVSTTDANFWRTHSWRYPFKRPINTPVESAMNCWEIQDRYEVMKVLMAHRPRIILHSKTVDETLRIRVLIASYKDYRAAAMCLWMGLRSTEAGHDSITPFEHGRRAVFAIAQDPKVFAQLNREMWMDIRDALSGF